MKRAVMIGLVMALVLVVGASTASAYYPGPGPAPVGFAPPPGGGTTHVVRPGENLSTIGWMYGVPYWEIARANGIYNPNVIYVGQCLIIPPGCGYNNCGWGGGYVGYNPCYGGGYCGQPYPQPMPYNTGCGGGCGGNYYHGGQGPAPMPYNQGMG